MSDDIRFAEYLPYTSLSFATSQQSLDHLGFPSLFVRFSIGPAETRPFLLCLDDSPKAKCNINDVAGRPPADPFSL